MKLLVIALALAGLTFAGTEAAWSKHHGKHNGWNQGNHYGWGRGGGRGCGNFNNGWNRGNGCGNFNNGWNQANGWNQNCRNRKNKSWRRLANGNFGRFWR